MTLYAGPPYGPETQRMYAPICYDTASVCLLFNGREYERSNFEAAGFTVTAMTNANTEDAYFHISSYHQANEVKTIHGTTYHFFNDTYAAMSHLQAVADYRVLHDGTCFGITLQVNFSDYCDPDFPEHPCTFRPEKLDALLNEMLESVSFTNP